MVVPVETDGFSVALNGLEEVTLLCCYIHHGWRERERGKEGERERRREREGGKEREREGREGREEK